MKYQYEHRLGGGGMAEVYLASTVGAEGFTRPVAIKRVLPHFSGDANFATMFISEARISSMLRHPNIVQVLDFDRDHEGSLYLVMELVEGKDLDHIVQSGRLPFSVIVYVTTEVLKGLAHAHEMTTPEGKPLGIVHRDISPHNVLVSWDGAVKVSDFGIAKATQASGAIASGMIKGKPMYMAPEQVTAPETVDHRADLFAVGVMLFEMLTGARVYKGETHQEVLTDVIQVANGWRQMVAPNQIQPDVPWDLAQVAMKLLAPTREARYQSARDAIDALHQVQSVSARGAELVSGLLLERYPDDAPARVRRNSGRASITPAPVPLASGTPASDSVRAQMAAVTNTAARPPTAALPSHEQATVMAKPTPKRSPALWVAIAGLAVAIGGVAIAIALSHGSSPSSAPAAATVPADAAVKPPPPSIDAAPRAAVVIDAGGGAAKPAPDAASLPIDAAPKPAPHPKPPHNGTGKGSGSSTTIHEIPLGGT